MRVSVEVIAVVSSSVDELVIDEGVLFVVVVVVVFVVDIVPDMLAVLSAVMFVDAVVSFAAVVLLTVVDVRVVLAVEGFSTVELHFGSVEVVVTVACSVPGVSVE